MNKYQEVLNDFIRIFEFYFLYCYLSEEEHERISNNIHKLFELVERATPKKPIKDKVQDVYYLTKYTCPTCGGKFTGMIANYCYHCGQALDWSEDERD